MFRTPRPNLEVVYQSTSFYIRWTWVNLLIYKQGILSAILFIFYYSLLRSPSICLQLFMLCLHLCLLSIPLSLFFHHLLLKVCFHHIEVLLVIHLPLPPLNLTRWKSLKPWRRWWSTATIATHPTTDLHTSTIPTKPNPATNASIAQNSSILDQSPTDPGERSMQRRRV